MTSPLVQVRRALPDDTDALAALHQRVTAVETTRLRARVAAALARDDVEVQLAVTGARAGGAGGAGGESAGGGAGRVVGVLVLRTARPDRQPPLHWSAAAGGAVHVEQLWVDPAWRRRGVARSLLAEAVATAEQLGAVDLACSVPASAREVHRFLARLGFGPPVTLRMVAVGRLQRALSCTAPGARPASGDRRRAAAIDSLLARRRRQQLTGVERRAAGT